MAQITCSHATCSWANTCRAGNNDRRDEKQGGREIGRRGRDKGKGDEKRDVRGEVDKREYKRTRGGRREGKRGCPKTFWSQIHPGYLSLRVLASCALCMMHCIA